MNKWLKDLIVWLGYLFIVFTLLLVLLAIPNDSTDIQTIIERMISYVFTCRRNENFTCPVPPPQPTVFELLERDLRSCTQDRCYVPTPSEAMKHLNSVFERDRDDPEYAQMLGNLSQTEGKCRVLKIVIQNLFAAKLYYETTMTHEQLEGETVRERGYEFFKRCEAIDHDIKFDELYHLGHLISNHDYREGLTYVKAFDWCKRSRFNEAFLVFSTAANLQWFETTHSEEKVELMKILTNIYSKLAY